MRNVNITPKQRDYYFATLNKYKQCRMLSQEEKEDLILRIISSEHIDLLCDWAFKHVFGHNKEHLMMLLNDFLPVKITGIDRIEYDPNEVDVLKGDDKQVIMDVLCHTDTEQIIVEMQKSNNNEFRNRMVYYGGSMIAKQLKKGERYDKLQPVYVICFMNFRLLHQTDQLVYRYQLREQDSHEPYGNQLSLYFCELPRFVKESEEKLTPVEQWFAILQNMSNFVNRPANIDKRFEPIFEACRQNQLDILEQEQYFSAMISKHEREGIAAAYKEEGLREGFEKGIEKGVIKVAKSLKEMGYPVEDICKATGLEKDVVEGL